jgi:hypothetical protein
MRWHRFGWAAGLIGLPVSHYWLLAKVEPFYSSIYCFVWWSYILAVDFVVWRLRGNSLLKDRPREFVLLAIWSVPVWMLFELVNLRIQNWYYVMAPWSFSGGVIFLMLAFGTVLPGIFETMELMLGVLERVRPGGKIWGRPLGIGGRGRTENSTSPRSSSAMQPSNRGEDGLLSPTLSSRGGGEEPAACVSFRPPKVVEAPKAWSLGAVRALWSVGLVMLVLLLVFPRYCYCLAWGFAFFLAEPVCYWARRGDKDQVGRSLLGQLASGDYTRLVALLLAGFLCGGVWEAWNFTARTKWIYSVPFFDELKLGEMPVLGFLGFPAFALECYALINLLSLARGGRNWELSAAENRERAGMAWWGVALSAVLLPVGMAGCLLAAIEFSIASFAAPVDFYFGAELGQNGVNALRQRNALEGNLFLRLRERPPEIAPALYDRMRRVVTLSECKGMGIENALALDQLRVTNLEELARQDPAELMEKLKRAGCGVRMEEVRIWVREAKRKPPSTKFQAPKKLQAPSSKTS